MVEGSIGEEYRGESPLCLTNKVSIQRFPQGQFIVTIPRALALALDIEKGDRAEWKLSDGDLVLKLLK
jgi:hypothetical protein